MLLFPRFNSTISLLLSRTYFSLPDGQKVLAVKTMETRYDVIFVIEKFSKAQAGSSPATAQVHSENYSPARPQNTRTHSPKNQSSQAANSSSTLRGSPPCKDVKHNVAPPSHVRTSSSTHPLSPPTSPASISSSTTWIHLATPKLSLKFQCITIPTVMLSQGKGNATISQSSLTNHRPQVIVASGSDILECMDLDAMALRISRLKALIKGVMIGFRYNYAIPDNSTPEVCKFQVKFSSSRDSGLCAQILNQYVECRAVGGSSANNPSLSSSSIIASHLKKQEHQQQGLAISSTSVLPHSTGFSSECTSQASASRYHLDGCVAALPLSSPFISPASTPLQTGFPSSYVCPASPIDGHSFQSIKTKRSLEQWRQQEKVHDELSAVNESPDDNLALEISMILFDPSFPTLLAVYAKAMLQDLDVSITLAIAAGVTLALVALAFVLLLLPTAGIDEDEPHWMFDWIQIIKATILDNLIYRSLSHFPVKLWNIASEHQDQWLVPLMKMLFGFDPMEFQSASSPRYGGRNTRHATSRLFGTHSPNANSNEQNRNMITSRTQLTQFSNHGARAHTSVHSQPAGHLVHGLVNTGNSCFLNSVLQALASLDLLLPYLETLLEHSESLHIAEEEVQVTVALADTIQALQQPIPSRKAFRPRAIVDALGNFRRKANSNRNYHGNLMNREQQDAQELFQLISTALSTEELFVQKSDATRPALDSTFLKHLAGILTKEEGIVSQCQESRPVLPSFCKSLNPLSGLLASRLSCMQCGYTEAIRHFTFDNLSLSLPSTNSCYLEECLQQYVNLESLHDVVCRKCSLQATLSRVKNDLLKIECFDRSPSPLQQEQYPRSALHYSCRRRRRIETRLQRISSDVEDDTFSSPSDTDEDDDHSSWGDDDDSDEVGAELAHAMKQDRLFGTNSNVEHLRATLIKQQMMLEQALKGDVEAPLPNIKISNIVSRHCTKQVMLARPPPVLCLHFIRSHYSMYGTLSKNACHVRFPEYLDLSPFCTTGTLLTQPTLPISIPGQKLARMELSQVPPHSDQMDISSRTKNKKKKKQKQQRPWKQEQPNDQSTAVHESDVRYIYRLQSIVVHFGGHSYGHFIAYRRKPENLRSQVETGPSGLGLLDAATETMGGYSWLRISDETVEPVSINQALSANPYMLLYERVILPDQKPTLQHQQAQTYRSPGSSLLAPSEARSQHIVQAVGLNKRSTRTELRNDKQEAVFSPQRDKYRSQNGRHADDCKREGLYHELPHPSAKQPQQSDRDGEDMSDMECLQSLDEDDSERYGRWCSFVSSPNSTTPPSPDTGTSACSSPASSSLTSPVMQQRTQLERGLRKRLSRRDEGCEDGDDGEEMDTGNKDLESRTVYGWAGDRCKEQAPQPWGEHTRKGPETSEITALPASHLPSPSLESPCLSPELSSHPPRIPLADSDPSTLTPTYTETSR